MTLFSEGAGHFWLLASTGMVTVVPLMLFAAATKALPLSVIGMVQYLGPTIQFVLALTVLHEQMSADKVLGLSLIWIALTFHRGCGARLPFLPRLRAVRPGNRYNPAGTS